MIRRSAKKVLVRIAKNWWTHNMLGHPLMQVVGVFSKSTASKIHDATLPEKHDETNHPLK